GFHLDTEENTNLVPGFLGSLIGIRPGETRTFPIQFPESFEQETLQGVRAQFTVVCKELFFRELPELDDSLAAKLLPGCNTIDEVKERILERCKEVEKTAIEQATDNAILDQLGKLVDVDVPRSLFQEQGQQLYGAKLLQLQAERKLDKDQLASLSSEKSVQEYLKGERENITRIIKQMLVVGEIFKAENLQYSTDQLVKEVENSIEEFKRYNQDYDEGNIKQQVQDVLEAAKVLEWLKENCTIEYIKK
uniref:Trigger factor C-terminal domain-containing protein n=3 Tax=Aegilops tauschii TaxID=37682 RepID=A0A453REL6_AEGTS